MNRYTPLALLTALFTTGLTAEWLINGWLS